MRVKPLRTWTGTDWVQLSAALSTAATVVLMAWTMLTEDSRLLAVTAISWTATLILSVLLLGLVVRRYRRRP